MSLESWAILIGAGIIVGIIVYMTVYLVKNKDKLRAEVYEMEEERLNDEGETVTLHVEVVDMMCDVKTIGHQMYTKPTATKRFAITFKADDGEILTVPVIEAFYDGFEIGLCGTLTLVDGELTSFEPEEE